MPEPREGEKQSEYIGRCVSYCMKEEGLEQKAALGKCYGMWRQAHKKNEDTDEVIPNIEDKMMAYIHDCDRFDIDMPLADYIQRCMELVAMEEEGTCTKDVDKTVAGKGNETTKGLERRMKNKKLRKRLMPEATEHKCEQCGKDMGNEWLLGPVCGKCVRKNHAAATGKKENIGPYKNRGYLPTKRA